MEGFDIGFEYDVEGIEAEAEAPMSDEERRECVADKLRKMHRSFNEKWKAFQSCAPYRVEGSVIFLRDGTLFDALALMYNVSDNNVKMSSGSAVQFLSARGFESPEGTLDSAVMIYRRHRIPYDTHVIKATIGGVGSETQTLWFVYADGEVIPTNEVEALEWLALCVRNSNDELAECPAIVGSVKQAASGEMLRAKAFKKVREKDWSDRSASEMKPFFEQTKAKYWIDRYGSKAA